jgi:hypothetical protein
MGFAKLNPSYDTRIRFIEGHDGRTHGIVLFYFGLLISAVPVSIDRIA